MKLQQQQLKALSDWLSKAENKMQASAKVGKVDVLQNKLIVA